MAVLPRSYISTFSGSGAIDTAIRRVFRSARCVCYVENEVSAGLRLAARMEEGRLDQAPVWSNVATFPGGMFRGRADMVVGSFPCQDLSRAGKRGGIHARRSGLFFKLMDVVRAVGSRYLFLENSAGIFDGRSLDAVHGEVAASGFDAVWGCLSAGDVGASHGRDRWWLLAWNPSVSGLADAMCGSGCQSDGYHDQRGWSRDTEQTGMGRSRDDGALAHATSGGDAFVSQVDGREPAVVGAVDRAGCRVVDGHPAARVPQRRRVEGQEPLGNPTVTRWGQITADTEHESRAAPDGSSGTVGDPERQGLALGGSVRRDVLRQQPPAERAGSALQVADANGGGRRERADEAQPEPSGWREPREPESSYGVLPEHPPGWKGDDGRWRDILDVYPELAPATESVLRRVVDVGAEHDRLDLCLCSRNDRIRLIGNAVDTRAAEWALRCLWFRAFGSWP